MGRRGATEVAEINKSAVRRSLIGVTERRKRSRQITGSGWMRELMYRWSGAEQYIKSPAYIIVTRTEGRECVKRRARTEAASRLEAMNGTKRTTGERPLDCPLNPKRTYFG